MTENDDLKSENDELENEHLVDSIIAHGENIQTFHLRETVGTIFLGILSLILLGALLRSEARNRKLLAQLAEGACTCPCCVSGACEEDSG